jgi:hypothetical protein
MAASTDDDGEGGGRRATSGIGPTETSDGWVIPMSGATVTQCRVDSAFTMVATAPDNGTFEVRIETGLRCSLIPDERLLDPEDDPRQLAPLLGLLQLEVLRATASSRGELALRFVDGTRLDVPADPDYEAWTLNGPNGLLLVSIPGGDVGVWGGVT